MIQQRFQKAYGKRFGRDGDVYGSGWHLKIDTPVELVIELNKGAKSVPKEYVFKEGAVGFWLPEPNEISDCDLIADLFEKHDVLLTLKECWEIWTAYSEDLCATWLGMSGDVEGLWSTLSKIYVELSSGQRQSYY
jgi:hypothetical protein